MNWIVFFCLSIFVFVESLIIWIYQIRRKKKTGRISSPFYFFFGGVFLSSILLLIPIYYECFRKGLLVESGAVVQNTVLHTIVTAIHYTLQMCTLNADSMTPLYCHLCESELLGNLYADLLSVEMILLPLFTFGFIISFFKNISSRLRFALRCFRDAYIFSELNENSITLAEDIKKNHPRATIVYANVDEKKDTVSSELIQKAKDDLAICFRQDISHIRLKFHWSGKKIHFFTIGENETENVILANEIVREYGKIRNVYLYVFTTQIEGELALNSIKNRGNMHIRRIQMSTSLIYHNLYKDGYRNLYETACRKELSERKKIAAVIVGLGSHGLEMIKSMAWFCQMAGYQLQMDVFDQDLMTEERLKAACPELIGDEFQSMEDDANYLIRIHPGMDVTTELFANTIKSLTETTYVLVSLGSDELNIRTAVNMRKLFAQAHVSEKNVPNPRPVIQAIVYNTFANSSLAEIANFRGEQYHISFFGDIAARYTEDVVMNSELEEAGKAIHFSYNGKEEEFYNFEYNYRSSCASAIHTMAVSREMMANSIDPTTLQWADYVLRLANCFVLPDGVKEDENSKKYSKIKDELENWGKAVLAIAEDLIREPGLFSWDAWKENRLLSDEKIEKWTGFWTNANEKLDKLIAGEPSWYLVPGPYSGVDENITVTSLMKIRSEIGKDPSGIRDNLHKLYMVEMLKEQEHKRWNAYMRSEGYIYSGSTDRKTRYDLAHMHHDLTKYEKIDLGEKNKDIRLGSIIEQMGKIRKEGRTPTE